jgi:phage tail-like protein
MAEYRTGTDKLNHVRKIQAMHKVGDVTCKRGVINTEFLWNWIDRARRLGPDGKKDRVVIKLLDEQRTVVQTWTLRSVAPTKYTGPTLNAKGGTDVAMEELVLSAESLDYGT